MQWQHLIKNGAVYQNGEFILANIYIKDGKIAAITDPNDDLGAADIVTDAKGLYVLPGLIDTHVHSRDPQATHKEDFYHSTLSAAMGGITTIFEMPNTAPSICNVENFTKQKNNFASKANVDFAMWGICLGDINKNEIAELDKAGVIAFKFFWGYAIDRENYLLIYSYKEGDPNAIPPLSDGEVFDIFKTVKATGKLLAVHAENSELMGRLTQDAQKHAQTDNYQNDYQMLLDGRSDLVEAATVQLGILFSKFSGTPLHILHLTSKEGVELIREAKQKGISVTAETCPHYLFLTNQDYDRVHNEMKVYPPIKHQHDQDALWQGIADGTISLICSDHAPHAYQEKQGDLFSAPAGMCGVETSVPLLLNAVNQGKLTLTRVVELMAENPAKLYNIYPKKGAIQVGSDADFTLVDMQKMHTITRDGLHSKSKTTAFDGYQVKGMPVMTIVRGQIVVKNGELICDHCGEFVSPNRT